MKRVKRIIALLLVFTIGFESSYLFEGSFYARASILKSVSSEELKDIYLSLENLDGSYQKYVEQYKAEQYVGEPITYAASQLSSEDMIISGEEQLSISLPVEKAGLYIIGFNYQTLGNNILQTNVSMALNGEYAYDELTRLLFSDTWRTGEKQYDRYGNESIAMPEKDNIWGFTYLRDTYFLNSEPLMLHLNQGNNTLTFQANEGSVQIGDISLSSQAVVEEDSQETATGENYILIEAEDITTRNSPNIRSAAEFNIDVTPYDTAKKVQNVVTEESFKTGGTKVDYEFEVSNEGYYNLAFDYRQSTKSNFIVYRNIFIDGQIPSTSFQNMGFKYSKNYKQVTTPAAVYLSEGIHTLTLEVSIDNYGDSVLIINQIVREINDLALQVNKITGGNTDKYRDFDLTLYGFTIEEDLLKWADLVDQVYSALTAINGGNHNVGDIALLKIASNNLSTLAEKPDDLPQNLDMFSYGNSSVRQYLTTVSGNISLGNLGLDNIIFYQKDANLPDKVGFIESLGLNVKHFFASFTQQDYVPGYEEEDDVLEIWVNRPRQYIEILQRMVDSEFTEKTGIKVNLSIVPDQQKLILANASGKAPDGAIGISTGYVYDLALRGALVNMREFDNFKEVGNRFAPGMLIPGVCDEGIYAIPETFNFYVMFYRTDIFDSLGLEVPDNMEAVRELLPQLARLGLEFNTHVANMVNKTYSATTPFIFQNGGALFEEGTMNCNLETEEVISGLEYLTENFTIYNMDYEVLSFYQAFRDGRIPIGVSDYASYNLLLNAAPELTGCWDIALYPGMLDENGEVSRYTSGAAESCILFSSSEQQEDSWKFMDWWMSTESQSEFAYTLQSTLGNEYLWNSANLDAIAASPWSSKHKDVIIEQISWTQEAPRVPGGYIIERELGNVLNSVVTSNTSIRTAIDNAQKRINRELTRKLEEFGYIDSEGNVLKKLIVPDIELVKEWLK